jgi:hypothetical protein
VLSGRGKYASPESEPSRDSTRQLMKRLDSAMELPIPGRKAELRQTQDVGAMHEAERVT